METKKIAKELTKWFNELGAWRTISRRTGISMKRLTKFSEGANLLNENELMKLRYALDDMKDYIPLQSGFITSDLKKELRGYLPKVGGVKELSVALGISKQHMAVILYTDKTIPAARGEHLHDVLTKTDLRYQMSRIKGDPDWRNNKSGSNFKGRTYEAMRKEEEQKRLKQISKHNKKRCILSVGDIIEYADSRFKDDGTKMKCKVVQELRDFYLLEVENGGKTTILKNNLICGEEDFRRL